MLRMIITLVRSFREVGRIATRGNGNKSQAKVGPDKRATIVKLTIGPIMTISVSQKKVEASPLVHPTKLK
jgi:hypothetical protein